MSDKFPLVKKRDLGDVIQHTIKLLSSEQAKVLWRNILLYALPIYLVGGFFLGQFQLDMQEVLPELQNGGITSIEEMMEALTKVFGFHYYMVVLFAIASSALLTAFTYNFMAAYHQSPSGEIESEALRSHSFSDILWMVGFQLLLGFIIGLGLLFFLVPGIYLAILLSILVAVAKIENLHFSDAFTRCRELMRDNWFNTLLVVLVTAVLVGIVSSIAGSILQAIFLLIDKNKGMVFASVLQNALAGGLSTFSIVAICLQYFNLRAIYEGEEDAINRDIEEIGK